VHANARTHRLPGAQSHHGRSRTPSCRKFGATPSVAVDLEWSTPTATHSPRTRALPPPASSARGSAGVRSPWSSHHSSTSRRSNGSAPASRSQFRAARCHDLQSELRPERRSPGRRHDASDAWPPCRASRRGQPLRAMCTPDCPPPGSGGASTAWSGTRRVGARWVQPSPLSSDRQRYQLATDACGLHFAPIRSTSFGSGRFLNPYAR
jgi:hypothetical protein